jgi:hypothetical protein
MIPSFSGSVKRNLFLPLVNIYSRTSLTHSWSKRPYSSPEDSDTDSKVYDVAFQMIAQRALPLIPPSLFILLEAKTVGKSLELHIEQYSQKDPEVKACWIGFGGRGTSKQKTYPRHLHVYLTGGKHDLPKSSSIRLARAAKLKLNLDLPALAQLVKQKGIKLDKESEVIFSTISPDHELFLGRSDKLVEKTKRAYHEFTRIKFSDFMTLTN